MDILNRVTPNSVALETTLLVHGLPSGAAIPLVRDLAGITARYGIEPAIIGILKGRPVIGVTEEELALLQASAIKANTANLGSLIFRRRDAATTVSATMEIAAAAGLRVFATGGLGGIHRNYAAHLDISSDMAAFARFPVAVIASGIKSFLDITATREALETLGVPVIGFRTDTCPAFYVRETDLPVDARFDSAEELAAFAAAELGRTGRGLLIVNPIPGDDAISPADWNAWLAEAEARTRNSAMRGRDITPAVLANLHEISGGATLRANIALVKCNVNLAAQLCRAMLKLC